MCRPSACPVHSPAILGRDHEGNRRRSWWVIALCAAMMVAEIGGGLLFGSIALVADGLHMSTHAGALLLAALAYSFASRHAADARFTFGTGKLGDLAGFTSAIVLAMIALLIGYEAVGRLFAPVPIHFAEAVPIAVLGLVVNVASVLLLSGGHHHAHGHGHDHGHDHGGGHGHADADQHRFEMPNGRLRLSIHEDGVPPRFHVRADGTVPDGVTVRTIRPDGTTQVFLTEWRDGVFESSDEIPEPHAFQATVSVAQADGSAHEFTAAFDEGNDPGLHRDNNMRAAIVHVVADAAVSALVIVGLVLARIFGWLWLDPLAGIVGAIVIATWAYALVRDTGKVLLDVVPDRAIARQVREAVERDGDELADFHLWRLGPGHLGAILSVVTAHRRDADFYRGKLARFRSLAHVTVELSHKG